jgi:aspartate-semialdehyde dehydrogenase
VAQGSRGASRREGEAVVSASFRWTDEHRGLRVAIVGANGATGQELVELLLDAGHPPGGLCLSARSRKTLFARGLELPVEPIEAGGAARCDLAFLCTPSEASLELAPRLCDAGVRVVDLSSALRMRPDIPLVVPEVNGDLLRAEPSLVANPNCTSAIALLPLSVVERLFGLAEVVVVSYQAASGAGAAGLDALRHELADLGAGGPGERAPGSPFAAALALNVIPAIAEVDADGHSGEERKIADELRKILRRDDLVVEATTARVPVERCHSVAVHLLARTEIDLPRLVQALRSTEGLAWCDDPHGPRPRECAGTDPVHVGRVRRGARGPRSLSFFAVGDQIRKGAALNAVQVAGLLAARRRRGG